MKIATYNVNSINARIDNLMNYLKEETPDIVFLQEIKTEFNSFPFFDLKILGYDAKVFGQKSYNGVAILSKFNMTVREENLPNFEDENARYLEVEIEVEGIKYILASVYLPNGNPPYNNPDDDTKKKYKLKWMEAFYYHAENLLKLNRPIIFGGDFNVIMTDNDVYNPKEFLNNALFLPEVRQRLRALQYLGYYDAYRSLYPVDSGYTFWDYSGAALTNDMGMRIDYFWMNALAFDRLTDVVVNKKTRIDNKPSDHTVLQAILK